MWRLGLPNSHAGVKRKMFYHLSLSLPYIALLISVAFTYLAEGFDVFSSPSPGIVSGTLMFFAFSAVIWAPLYTWMVVVMLLWGRGRTETEIRTLYLLSPALLSGAMGIPALLVSLPDSGLFLLWGFMRLNHLDFVIPILFEEYSVDDAMAVVFVWAFMAALCLVIGYAFVGCGLLLERVMHRRGFFVEEQSSGENLS
jgi:hypothetical protein